MSYPATYNFSYYRGDTYQFNILPKDAAGVAFPLTGYNAIFSIAPSDGSSAAVEAPTGSAVISGGEVQCQILSDFGKNLLIKPYIYDITIKKAALVYTILKGTITVSPDVKAD